MPNNTLNNQTNQPSMADLMRHVGTDSLVSAGETIKGKVIFIVKNQVLIDIPNKGVGIVRGKELYNEEFLSHLTVGEEVDALVIKADNELGVIELSFKAIGHERTWNNIREAIEQKLTVDAKIRDANRGGFIVKVKGVDGFLPASLLSNNHAIKQVGTDDKSLLNQIKKYVGQTFQVKILNINTDTENVIVSEKAVTDESVKAKLAKYKIGDVIEGIVAGAVDFGLFVRFDSDLDGLVHISELAWKKIEDPRTEYKIGSKVTAQIIDIDKDNRINLSIKQTIPNPWLNFSKKFKVGDKFTGKVSKIVSFGAIVVNEELDIQGLCHISQISDKYLENAGQINEIIEIGEIKEFTILSLDSEEKLYLTLLDYTEALKIQNELLSKQKDESKIELASLDEASNLE